MEPRDGRRCRRSLETSRGAGALGLVLALAVAPSAAAQTINGTLMDLQTDQPIPLGLVLMFTESGDSVTSAVTDVRGGFSLSSPSPGNFLLLAGALGYREAPAGTFELGEDGVLQVEYRLAPEPLPIDALVVSLDRPVQAHRLVGNGFVRRFQRGLGAFVTPHDIEESSATSTEQLLTHIPQVRVGAVRIARPVGTNEWTVYPRPDVGETVQIRSPVGGWCTPTVYVDGVRTFYESDAQSYAQGVTLSTLAPLGTVEAMEVYRRPAEIPPEYSVGPTSNCGVLVVWTKTGLAPGQRATSRSSIDGVGPDVERLPSLGERGVPPESGERIRMELNADVVAPLGLPPTWAGTFVGVHDGELVATDVQSGRPVAVPLSAVQGLQVRRSRAPARAYLRSAIAGGATAAGTWFGLRLLCAWSDCNGAVEEPWLPATAAGLLVGYLVHRQGPGEHWVGSALPEIAPGSGGIGLRVRLPAVGR
jgi:hypothetical protein